VKCAEAAVAVAQEEFRNVDSKMTAARASVCNTQARLINTEFTELESERAVAVDDRLYRLKLESPLAHDEALAARRATQQAEEDHSQASAEPAVRNELDKGVSTAQASLARARERLRLAEAGSDLRANGMGIEPMRPFRSLASPTCT
jgi:multidrug resistance efflux pump